MKKFTAMLALALLLSGTAFGQRYLNPTFSDIQITRGEVYATDVETFNGNTTSLIMDVYQPNPATDPIASTTGRPVVIFFHAGSWLPGCNSDGSLCFFQPSQPMGNLDEYHGQELCNRFAQMGYVAIFASYRYGWSPNRNASTTEERETNAAGIIRAAWRSFGDGRGLVRFLKHNALNGDNKYKINPNKIAVGGAESGGYIPLGMLYFNKDSELDLSTIKWTVGANAGKRFIDFTDTECHCGADILGPVNRNLLTGNVTDEIQFGFTLGGCLPDSSFIEGGEAPVVSMHGDANPPGVYNSGVIQPNGFSQPIINVFGGNSIIRRAQRLGNQDTLKSVTEPSNVTWNWADKSNDNQNREGLYTFAGRGVLPFGFYDSYTNNLSGGTAPADEAHQGRGTAYETVAYTYIDTVTWYVASRMNHVLNGKADAYSVETFATTGTKDAINLSGDISLYPNPAAGQLFVEFRRSGAELQGVELLDLSGRSVLVQQAFDSTNLMADLSSLRAGVYLVRVSTTAGVHTTKIVKQ